MKKRSSDIRNNKINIYLIKDKYFDEDSITKIADDSSISKVDIAGVGIFYYKKSIVNSPEWLSSFFNNHSSIDASHFFGSGSKGVLIVKIPYKRKIRYFAIPFGSGRFLLQDSSFEERFGLITSLNILESKSIRGIDKRTLSTNPKTTREQIARASDAIEFQIDFEKDLIQSITGRSTDTTFGNFVTGKEALSISAKIDISNIKDFLKKTLITFEKKDYLTNFKWIDQIKEVRIQETVDKLNSKLIKIINDKNSNVWLAVPEIIDWTDFKGFKYSTTKNDKLHDELELAVFLKETGITISTVEELEILFITCWGASEDDYTQRWNVFTCLNAEIDLSKKKYFLINAKWYEINADFVASVNKSFEDIKLIDLNLPEYNHDNEGAYNEAAASHINALCLDRKNLPYGGGQSKIEFCDILTNDKKIIHVKKYGGSSLLSHLFNQGFVSAELLLLDEDFRKLVINVLSKERGFRSVVPTKKPNASEYKIIYAIITTQKKKFNIPFFSKVVLKNNKKILEAYGYEIFLTKIPNVKVSDKD